MQSMNLPLEIYDILERKFGRDEAMPIAKAIDASLSHMAERSREMANQRKLEVKEELKIELRNELATKEDIAKSEASVRQELAKSEASVRQELAKSEASVRQELAKMDKKFTVYFIVTISTVILLNQNALEFLARILGLLK